MLWCTRHGEAKDGQNADVPKAVQLHGETPLSVLEAIRGLGSEVRVRLIRHYRQHPGSQAEAARALGLSTAMTTQHTQALVELGIVAVTVPDGARRPIYSVDHERCRELGEALIAYVTE